MDQAKVATTAQKIRAVALGFIGAMFFSMGISYFSPQLIYRMPRILVPIYELTGGTGLAVSLVILGLGLIWWGLSAWKKAGGKTFAYCILAAIALAVGIVLFNVDLGSQKNSEEAMEEYVEQAQQAQQEQIDEIRNTERPEFTNDKANAYFDEFEALLARFKTSTEEGNGDDVEACEKEFEELAMTSPDALQELSNEKKYEFSLYNARLMMEWDELRNNE